MYQSQSARQRPCEGCLSACWKSHDHDQDGSWERVGVGIRQVEIRFGITRKIGGGDGVQPRVGETKRDDLPAHKCSVALVKIQKQQQVLVAGEANVCLDEGRGQVGATQMFEVHRQKRDFGGDVSAAEARIELNTIEEVGLSPRDTYAGRVQIAVSIANSPVLDPPLEQLGV